MATTYERVYLGRDNTVDLILKLNGVAQSLAGVTRITLDFDGTVVDSDDYTDEIVWVTGTTGKVVLKLGLVLETLGVAAGAYTVDFVLFDDTYTNGLHWATVNFTVSESLPTE